MAIIDDGSKYKYKNIDVIKKEGMINNKLEDFEPRIFSPNLEREKVLLEDVNEFYKKHKKKGQFGFTSPGGGGVSVTVPQYYLPELASPDRLFFPSRLDQAIKYWRFFYMLDPVAGNVIDMYAELLTSDFTLGGPGVEGTVKDIFYQAMEDTEVVPLFRYFTILFLVDGEVVPHLYWDKDKGHWSYLAFLDPVYINVIDIPFVNAEPYIELTISPEIQKILRSKTPAAEKFIRKMPSEFLQYVYSGSGVPVDTEFNATYIPRKLTPFDVRGTSIFARMWRVFMYEDAIVNASMQTARRAASPIKVVKMGNPATGWIPGPEHERKLRDLLAIAETDPQAWIIYHYGVSMEMWGDPARTLSISREWDSIERMKLIALGVSKAFLHGEVTYAAAEKGLQIFLARLKGLRAFFENKWLKKKFFRLISVTNKFIRPFKSELDHRVRVKRSSRELSEAQRYIVPEIYWEHTLDPQVRESLLRAIESLKKLGIEISDTTALGTVNLDLEEEQKRIKEERELKEKIKNQKEEKEVEKRVSPYEDLLKQKPEVIQDKDKVPQVSEPSKEEIKVKEEDRNSVNSLFLSSKIWDKDGKYKNWSYYDVEGLVELIKIGDTFDEFWKGLKEGNRRKVKKDTGKKGYIIRVKKGGKEPFLVVNREDLKVIEKHQVVDRDPEIGDWVMIDKSGVNFYGIVEREFPIMEEVEELVDEGFIPGDYSWNNIREYLIARDISDEDIESLREILEFENLLKVKSEEGGEDIEEGELLPVSEE